VNSVYQALFSPPAPQPGNEVNQYYAMTICL